MRVHDAAGESAANYQHQCAIPIAKRLYEEDTCSAALPV
jgi:hypothetical protein